MNLRKRPFIWLLAAALLGTVGYAYYRAQVRQAATLVRIAALETRLATRNQRRAEVAKNTVLGISTDVSRNHNMAADVAVLRQTQQIQDSTQTLLVELHQLQQSWQGHDSKPEINVLSTQVDRYIGFIRRFLPETPPLTKPSAQTTSTGWLGEFDIATEPKPAALAQLTKLETQVRQLEAEVLAKQTEKMVFEGVFDGIGAFAAPVSTIVSPGEVYQAQLMLVPFITSGRRRFSVDGREIAINPATQQGLVQFRVPAAQLGQPDTVRAQWRGRVQLPFAAIDTVLEVMVPYFIVKPHLR